MTSTELPDQKSGGNSAGDLNERKFERRIKYLDLFVKFLAGGGIAILIWYLGSKAEESRREIAAKAEEARYQTAQEVKKLTYRMEFSAKQKEVDVNLSMRMFETLLSSYLKKKEEPNKQEALQRQMLLLRLIASNFQDVPLNLKPLFEELERQLTRPQDKQELKEIAQEIARRQAYRLTINGVDLQEIRLKKEHNEVKMTLNDKDKVQLENLPFTLEINELGQNALKASFTYQDRTIGPFTVGFFDMPIVDNTKIGDFRASLLLLKLNGDNATVRLITFPSDLAADRFDLKELTQDERLKVPEE